PSSIASTATATSSATTGAPHPCSSASPPPARRSTPGTPPDATPRRGMSGPYLLDCDRDVRWVSTGPAWNLHLDRHRVALRRIGWNFKEHQVQARVCRIEN